MVEKLASAIYNNIVGGLGGFTSTPNLSLLQLQDEIIEERLQVIKEYSMKNMVPRNDLLMSINCIEIDCKSLDKCPCNTQNYSLPIAHFELPQIVNDFANEATEFVGSIDRGIQFKVYTNTAWQYHKYLRRGSEKPFVYIEPTPNDNNMYDAWIFNAPLLKRISVIAIFKDPRQLEQYDCCKGDDIENYTFISTEIKKRLTEKYIRYYRSLGAQPTPNNQVPK